MPVHVRLVSILRFYHNYRKLIFLQLSSRKCIKNCSRDYNLGKDIHPLLTYRIPCCIVTLYLSFSPFVVVHSDGAESMQINAISAIFRQPREEVVAS